MKDDWKGMQFDLREKYKSTDTYILRGTEDVIALLDEHVLTTQALQFSPHKKPFETEIAEWALQLSTVGRGNPER